MYNDIIELRACKKARDYHNYLPFNRYSHPLRLFFYVLGIVGHAASYDGE